MVMGDPINDTYVDTQLNGPSTLTFKFPPNAPKAEYLTPDATIRVGGRSFTLMSPVMEVTSREGRKLWTEYKAQEEWILLGKVFTTVANDHEPDPPWSTVSILASDLGKGGYPAGSAGSALYRLLQGSGWSLGIVDTTGTLGEQHDLETERLTLLENIQKVQEIWGGYLVWDSILKTVSLREESAWRPGSGVQIRYAKNLKGITREISSDLVTRLYPFGQDDLSIASVNGGQLFIDDHHYSEGVYEGIWQNQNISDPAELLKAAQTVLAEVSEPRVSYRIDVADLSVLKEYSHEAFGVGAVVRIIDPELNIDTEARVIRFRYNVFKRHEVEIEIGKPTKTLAAMIAGGVRAADFVEKALKPNPGTGNLLKGFVNTFRTTINSASGKLVWSDDTLDAIEVDGQGEETGNRVRLTPGGVGISTDGGQSFVTAMTGQGILANAVIVSDLYALSSDDGYTRVQGNGLHVFDTIQQERVHVGRWLIEGVEHYGIRIFSASGTTLLDDRGILQTWQEGYPDNVDVGCPHRLEIYLPPETVSIKRALLRIRRQAFRSYALGVSTSSGGDITVALSADTGGASAMTTSGPSATDTTGPTSTSSGLADGTVGQHSHSIPHAHGMSHTHTLPHTHGMSHSHTIPAHSHSLVYGVSTQGATLTGITVTINGTDRTAALGGPFNADQTSLDISAYLVIGAWNTIDVGASVMGRVNAMIFMQAFMGV